MNYQINDVVFTIYGELARIIEVKRQGDEVAYYLSQYVMGEKKFLMPSDIMAKTNIRLEDNKI